MRKIITILFSVFFYIVGVAQTLPNYQSFGSPTTLTEFKGVSRAAVGNILTRYSDTTAANANPYIKNYPAAQIWVNDTVYVRDVTASRWIAQGVGSGGGGPGSVTNFSIVTANGFSGSVTNPTTTPALTITTPITGLLKGNGTAMSAAVLGTDYSLINGTGFVKASGTTLSYDNSIYTSSASEGLSILSGDVKLGGTIASPSYFTTERVVSVNRKIMHWTNGVLPTSGGPSFLPNFPTNINWSPYQFISSDTLIANDLSVPSIDVPYAGVFASRQIYYADGIIRNQKMFGHQFQLQWNFKDTISVDTRGGDYNIPFKVNNLITPRGTGRQGIRASHGTNQTNSRYYAAPTLLVNTQLHNSAGNYIYVNGHLSGVNSYLIMGETNPDTIGRYIAFTNGGFVSTGSHIGIYYDFAPAFTYTDDAAKVDSAYLMFDTTRRKHWHHAAKTVIGPSVNTVYPWSSSDQLKVLGNVNIIDSLNVGRMLSWNDSTDIDIVLSPRTAGLHALRKIRFDQFASLVGGSSSLFPATGTGTATSNVIGDLVGNELQVNSGGNPFLIIDPSAGSEVVLLRAVNTTNDDNQALFTGSTSNTDAQFNIAANFNDGVKVSGITGLADATTSTITHAADNHIFNGAVTLNDGTAAAGYVWTSTNGTGIGSWQPAGGSISDGDKGDITVSSSGSVWTIDNSVVTMAKLSTTGTPDGTKFLRDDGQWTAISGGGDALTSNPLSQFASTTSLQLLGVISNETGTGALVFGTSPTFTTSILIAGGTSGNITLAAEALSNVLLGTNLSGTGLVPIDFDIVTRADETLANTSADQPMLTNTAHDVITIQANTTYDFEVRADFTHGAVSHNLEFGMLPTTATITSIEYIAMGWVTAVGTNTASQNTLRQKSTATTQVIAAGANGTETLWVSGTFTVGATGGTIMPSIQMSADPTGTVLLKTGARVKITARGNDTFTERGPIN